MQEEGFKNAPNTGRLFQEDSVQVVRKGTINTPYVDSNGETQYEDRYYAILLFTKRNDAGEVEYQKYELAMSIGRLYMNDKKNEDSPDIDGPVTIDQQELKFCGWKKTASNGKPYTKASLYERKQADGDFKADEDTAPFPPSDDDIPF